MRLRPVCAFIFLAGTLPLSATAQPGPVTGFSFLRVAPSARAAALGGSLSSVCCEDLGAFFYNPALLSTSVDQLLSVSYLNHLHDLSAGFAAYSRDIGTYGTAAAGLRFFSYGQLERADEAGNRTGTFSASDIVLTLGGGRAYQDNVRYGASIHLVYTGIDQYRATALLVDIGMAYHDSARRLTASASINGAGMVLRSLGSVADEIPLDIRVSVAKGLRYVPLFVTLTAYNLHDLGAPFEGSTADRIAQQMIVGLEFNVVAAFTLRAGYNHRQHQNLSSGNRLDIAGAGMGFGLRVRRFALDYAYSSWSFAGLHQFTVSARL